MITKFVGREEELDFLDKRYKNKNFQLIPIYGRRRVGKTELVLNFIKDKKSIYFLATSGTKKENIEKFKLASKHVINLDSLKDDWEDIFKYIKDSIKSRLVIVIDEFPYLLETEKGLSSLFQRMIDLHLKDSSIFLILCGSSLSMMHKEVLSYKAPLYGRRTGQLEIKPLGFIDVFRFFNKSFEDIVKIYAICGGIPAYLNEFSEDKPILNLISEKILVRGSLLREEVQFLLREEFRDPKVYLSIMSAISLGNRKLGEIINYCGFRDKTSITPYLHNLENLDYVRRELPITEKPKSKKGLYFINDAFFNFWFRLVRRNFDLIERDTSLAIEKIKGELNVHTSLIFEDICKQFLWYKAPIKFNKLGKWWDKDKEIDLVALNEKTKQIIFVECKFQEGVNAEKLLEELKKKLSFVKWNNDNRVEYYALFSKSFKGQKIEQKNVFLFNFEAIAKGFKHH